MIRTFLIRSLFVCLFLAASGVILLATAAVLAFQSPGFYAEIVDRPYSAEEVQAASADLEKLGQTLDRWSQFAAARQRLSETAKGDQRAFLETVAVAIGEDAMQDVQKVTVTSDQINAVLQGDTELRSGDIRQFRLQFSEQMVQLGFELRTPLGGLIVSVDLKPGPTTTGDLQFDILGGRVGRLPIPLQTLLQALPADKVQGKNRVQCDLSANPPRLTILTQSHGPPPHFRVKEVRCVTGTMALELEAPTPSQPAAVAGSRVVSVP